MNRERGGLAILRSSLVFKFTLSVLGVLVALQGMVFFLWYSGWTPGFLIQLQSANPAGPVRTDWFIRLALIGTGAVLFVSVVFYFLIRFDVLIPVRKLLVANRRTDSTLPEFISEETIPDHEIGMLMRSRNEHLNSLGEFFRSEAVETLVEAVDAKDPYTRGHSHRVGQFGKRLAEAADLESAIVREVKQSGILHDLGKIGIPESILAKPDELTDAEFEKIKNHPERGTNIIQFQNLSSNVIDGIRYHHERYDGNGYPEGLSGNDIPLFGRILGVADAVDAMLTDRRYQEALTLEATREELRVHAGTQFDPDFSELAVDLLSDPDWASLPDFDEHRARSLRD